MPQGKNPKKPSRQQRVRYRVQAPVDVTVLRSGIPDTLPGRSVNLSEGGVAAVIAGELLPGEAVGVEIRLPQTSEPLISRALVKHHDKLRSGMEFVGLSQKQQATIRRWAQQSKAEPEKAIPPRIAIESGKPFGQLGRGGGELQSPDHGARRRGWFFLLVSAAILLTILWWRWNREWQDLESGPRSNENTKEIPHPEARVPADVMEKLVIHRVDPDYPAAARPEKLQGVIVLDIVVGRDGSVVDLQALNGPDILAQSAIAALRWWRFEPYRVNGEPVVVESTVAVEFKP